MNYRFPSAMGEAQAAGAHVNPDYLDEVVDEVGKLLLSAPVDMRDREKRIRSVLEAIDAGVVELILMAVEKCPSRDYILHHEDGRIVRSISELA